MIGWTNTIAPGWNTNVGGFVAGGPYNSPGMMMPGTPGDLRMMGMAGGCGGPMMTGPGPQTGVSLSTMGGDPTKPMPRISVSGAAGGGPPALPKPRTSITLQSQEVTTSVI